VYVRPVVGLAARLATRLAAGYITSAVRVIDRARALRAVLIVLIV
jgi:hypothetical protein